LVDGMDRKAERVPGGGGVRGAIAVQEDRRVDGDAVGDVARARHRLEALVPPEQLDETPPDGFRQLLLPHRACATFKARLARGYVTGLNQYSYRHGTPFRSKRADRRASSDALSNA